MPSHEGQSVIQAMSTAISEEIALIKEATSGILNLMINLVGKDRTSYSLAEKLEKADDLDEALRNMHCISVPYVNREAFEKDMSEAGIKFLRNSDIEVGDIENQLYVIDNRDKKNTLEILRKYNYLQPRRIITNEEQEKEYFQGCPITDVSGFDKLSVNRALKLLDEKGVLVSVSMNHSTGEYTLRVPRDQEKALLDTIKDLVLLKEHPENQWIQATTAYRSLMNNYIKNAGDFTPDNPCIIFDSERPNHYLVVSKEGYEERWIAENENGEREDQFVYRNSLNNAITKKQYEAMLNSNNSKEREKAADYKPSYMKMPENREQFDIALERIADRMGTVSVVEKKEFDKLTEEQKLAPGIVTQRALESELILTQEGDRLKGYTITRDEKGRLYIELSTSIQHGEVDVNRDKIDRAVKSTEAEKILDVQEIGIYKMDQQKQTPHEKNKRIEQEATRIETNLVIRSTGFAAGELKRDRHNIERERNRNSREYDYRDINRSGSISDELAKAEKLSLPHSIDNSERYLDDYATDRNNDEEKLLFDED